MVVDLDLAESERGDYVVVSVGGEIDVYTAPTLRQKLNEVLDRGTGNLCIDLGNVQFLDSTGLGVLVGAMKRINSREGQLVIVCDRPHILKVFEITGLSQVFEIRSSLDDV
jgi:anti-sigma B factor antagonist